MSEVFMPMDQVSGKPVIHMAVCDQQRVDSAKIQPILQRMNIGIRWEINQQAIVQEGLCPGTQVP